MNKRQKKKNQKKNQEALVKAFWASPPSDIGNYIGMAALKKPEFINLRPTNASPNATIYGTLGRGMAFNMNRLALEQACGANLIVVDPKGEYSELKNKVKNNA